MCVCRAALARSKGWAPRPLPQPKLQPTADTTAADSIATAAVSGGAHSADAAVQAMPWHNPGIRFTSAPVVDDDDMMKGTQAGHMHAHNHLAEPADQVGACLTVTTV